MSPLRVLVVDDDDDIREAFAEALEDDGHVVSTAANGREALAVLSETPRPELILLDLLMPVMNGWQLIEALEQNPAWAEIPVVVVSATGGEGLERHRIAAFLSKPMDVQALLDTVRRVGGRRD